MTQTHPLAGLEVQNEHGKPVALDTLWQHSPVMLVFVRHFGCMFCQQQVAELAGAEALEQTGIQVVVIGNGAPTFIEGFRQRSHFSGPILTDPSRSTYRALGMRRDLRSSLNRRTVGQALAAFRAGHRQASIEGDPWQQGGIVIALPGGELAYHYVSQFGGDHPPVAELVSQARQAMAKFDATSQEQAA